ncbi:MAG: hypothetical protein ACOC2F_01035 [Bacteroidota bacterium]
MLYKVMLSLIVALYFTVHLYGSLQVVGDISGNTKVETDQTLSQQILPTPDPKEQSDENTQESFLKQFFTPVFNVIHFFLFFGVVLLYIRSRKLKRRLHRTRAKLHNESLKFNHRLDHLTLEQKELKKIIKEYSEIQY